MKKTIETVNFSLLPGFTATAFMAANDKFNTWLKKQPGFESRTLCSREDGSWLDIVRWTSLTDAKQAAEKIMVEIGNCECMQMIDPSSITMAHSELQLEV